jgi:hypothetical protein
MANNERCHRSREHTLAKERERLVVRIEDHLLRLAGIGADEHHPAVAEADVGDFHGYRHAVDHHDLVAPVELVGLARIEAQRYIRGRRRFRLCLGPTGRVSPNGIVATVIAEAAQLLEDADMGQALALRPARVLGQKVVELGSPGPDLRLRLDAALIGELRRARADHLPHRLP